MTLSPTGNRLAARTGGGTVRLLATDPWHRDRAARIAAGGRSTRPPSRPTARRWRRLSAEMGEVALWSAPTGRFSAASPDPPPRASTPTASALAYSSDGASAGDVAGDGHRSRQRDDQQLADRRRPRFTLAINPENLGFSAAGGGVPPIRFTAGDAKLFVETDYQIGDSPTSTRLELRDPTRARRSFFTTSTAADFSAMRVAPDGRTSRARRRRRRPRQGFAAGSDRLRRDDRDADGIRPQLHGDGDRLLARRRRALHRDRHHRRRRGGAADLHPSVNSRSRPASPFWASRRRASWSVRSSGSTSWWDPSTGAVVRVLELCPRRRHLVGRRPLRRRHRQSGRAVSLLARGRRRAALRAGGRRQHARRRWRRWGRPDRPARTRPRPRATAR